MTINSVPGVQHFRCDCGWQGHEDQLRTECVFWGTREEPPEYDAFCPECNNNWENMEEVPLCSNCEDAFVKNEGDVCAPCDADYPYVCMGCLGRTENENMVCPDCEQVFQEECRRP